MLVSHSYRLVFVHIQKTGGDTVSRLLSDSVPDIFRFKAKHGFAIEAAKDLDHWDEYFKFAFVRNHVQPVGLHNRQQGQLARRFRRPIREFRERPTQSLQ